ncbi:hypothetical protein GN244_ATG15166 [Phytophthora infestans]|uniref:Uncharacterized protein n=1 Tax=Phytophthora infestans TaxID=4787 RepID=A0A833W7U4_PHYIN|nr:hypothetical protein GN244_ATG15166 [Phytophthora infestans]
MCLSLLQLINKSGPDSGLTTEHLKSHLQKYRINYERSRQEFRELCHREVKRRRRKEEHGSNVGDPDHCDSYSEGDGYSRTKPFSVNPARVDVASIPAEYQQTPVVAPVSSAMPELNDAQWRMFSTLMMAPPLDDTLSIQIPTEAPLSSLTQAQDNLHLQMYQAMQAQMNFHREMLARKVQLSNDLHQCDGLETWSGNYQVQNERSAFQQAWTNTQQIHQRQLASHRLQQQINQFGIPQQQRPSPVPENPRHPMANLLASVAGRSLT